MIGINQQPLLFADEWHKQYRESKVEPTGAHAAIHIRQNQENDSNSFITPNQKLGNGTSIPYCLKTQKNLDVIPTTAVSSPHFANPVKAARRKFSLKRAAPSTYPIPIAPKQDSTGRAPKPYQGNTRLDNSLLVTTKKFLALKSFNDTVNLNDAAEELNVPKRRLYDITNVLEGIDLVEKIGKNSIRWKTNDGDAPEIDVLKSECQVLQEEENELDGVLQDLASAIKLMKEDPTSNVHGYLRIQDLRTLDTFKDQTMVAVKSSADAQCSIEIADQEITGKYQLKMMTDNYSALKAFLCPSNSCEYSSVDDVLAAAQQVKEPCEPSVAQKDSTDFQPVSLPSVQTEKEPKPSSTAEDNCMNDIVLPKTQLRHDSLLDLITPDKVMFHGMGGSPLKMLLDSHSQFMNNDLESTSFLSQDRVDSDLYNFPSVGLSINDLFGPSDWDLSR